ncbi:hypothetical protein BDZ45DRAFT_675910 [Acephala macrosclerotiorum]|nr:hypothetical protein BDZ45DRAFT_675910 [Acephala macrosclerotiorum]
MDFLSKAKESFGSNNSQGVQGGQPAAGNVQGGAAGQEDYGDKGLDFIEKKTGHTMGRDTNEKITDGARGLYEKATGNKVDPKYSN